MSFTVRAAENQAAAQRATSQAENSTLFTNPAHMSETRSLSGCTSWQPQNRPDGGRTCMDFMKLVEAARTCRRFDEASPLTPKDLDWLLGCARLAPSARNAQVIRYVTVLRGKTLDSLFGMTRWAGALPDWDGPEPGERPTAFIAMLLPDGHDRLAMVDAGIACQTVQLAAASRGMGCCIIQSFDHAAADALLQIPSGMHAFLLLALGVAREKRVACAAAPEMSLAYWRDAAGVHHVPKLALDQLVLRRFG